MELDAGRYGYGVGVASLNCGQNGFSFWPVAQNAEPRIRLDGWPIMGTGSVSSNWEVPGMFGAL